MNNQRDAYVKYLEKQLTRAKFERERAARAVSLIESKLADPDTAMAKELKRGAIKFKKMIGVAGGVPRVGKTLLEQTEDASKKLKEEIKAEKEKKKSFLESFLSEDDE